jgi:hypothetical protein
MYTGEANIAQEGLQRFMRAAKKFQVAGLQEEEADRRVKEEERDTTLTQVDVMEEEQREQVELEEDVLYREENTGEEEVTEEKHIKEYDDDGEPVDEDDVLCKGEVGPELDILLPGGGADEREAVPCPDVTSLTTEQLAAGLLLLERPSPLTLDTRADEDVGSDEENDSEDEEEAEDTEGDNRDFDVEEDEDVDNCPLKEEPWMEPMDTETDSDHRDSDNQVEEEEDDVKEEPSAEPLEALTRVLIKSEAPDTEDDNDDDENKALSARLGDRRRKMWGLKKRWTQ